jgi:signal-transduction protein with cAMP-binding, CBS, and nucleotidyltransferase domain
MSLVEAVANVFVGYGVAVLTQILIFPTFGLHTTLAQNLKMGAIFTIVSIARSFALRRVFEAIRIRARKPPLIRRRLPYRRDFSGTAGRDQSSIR